MKIIRGDHWKKIKKEREILDNLKCVMCNSKISLICHHITYKNYPNEKIEDVMTVCRECHALVHKDKIWKWEKERNAIWIRKKKYYGVILIDDILFEKMSRPKKVNILMNKNNLIQIIPNSEGEFILDKIRIGKKEYYGVNDRIFKNLQKEDIKYISIKFDIKKKILEFKANTIFTSNL